MQFKIDSAPLGEDLQPLSVYWHQQGIPHRIVEEQGEQAIYAHREEDSTRLKSDYARFTRGELTLSLTKVSRPYRQSMMVAALSKTPVTLTLFALSVIGFFLVEFKIDHLVDLLVIQSVDNSVIPQLLDIPRQVSIGEYLQHGHYWRLLTPIFLHFGWVHITFNMLWLWELGRRIEVHAGTMHLLCVVIVIGVASNLYQAESTPYAVFGGMSGVIYGLLGYCLIFNIIAPQKQFRLPLAIYVMMLASLAIGYLGIFDFLAQMANTAHLSGLIIGLIMGFFTALLYRFVPAS